MRNRRTVLYLLLLIALLLGANLFVRYGIREIKVSGRQTLVEDAEGIYGIRLERKGILAASLKRADGKWRLDEPYSASVDEKVVLKFVDALATTPITDVIGESALLKLGRTRADFSLEEPPLSVTLLSDRGEVSRLDIGSKVPLSDGVYVSIGGLDSVFVVPAAILKSVDLDVERFRRRMLFTIDANSVVSFGIKRRADPMLEFSRTEDGWCAGDVRISSQKVSDLLGKITAASAESFVWPVGASNETEHASEALLVGYGLDPDTAVTMTVKGTDGVDRRISFGKEARDGRVYALVHSGTAIVTLAADLKALADQDASAFTDSRIFPVELKNVGSFSISDHDVLYAFVREKDGVWALESPIIARADGEAVESVLSRILALSVSDGATVPEDGVAVSLTTNTAKTVVSRASVFGTTKLEDFRSREIIKVDPNLVKRIVRIADKTPAPVSVVYDRERKGWNLENGGVDVVPDTKGISTVLSSINPLIALRIERLKVSAKDLDDYGLDSPFLTVAIDQELDGAVRRNIIVGKRTKDGRFATIGSSDAIFVISDDQVDALSSEIAGK